MSTAATANWRTAKVSSAPKFCCYVGARWRWCSSQRAICPANNNNNNDYNRNNGNSLAQNWPQTTQVSENLAPKWGGQIMARCAMGPTWTVLGRPLNKCKLFIGRASKMHNTNTPPKRTKAALQYRNGCAPAAHLCTRHISLAPAQQQTGPNLAPLLLSSCVCVLCVWPPICCVVLCCVALCARVFAFVCGGAALRSARLSATITRWQLERPNAPQ